MRRFLLFAAAIVGLVFASCEGSEHIGKGEIEITSESVVEIGRYNGEFTINYEIKGVTDVEANVSLTSEWLRVANHKSGTIKVAYE